MQIFLINGGKKTKTKLERNAKIIDVIKKTGKNRQTFVIKLNGKIAHEEKKLKEKDKLELIGVIYGG